MNERSLFLEALDITAPAERAAFLDRACDGDADLRKGVEDLLAANARSGSFMHRPAGGDVTADHRPSEGPGSRVGPYKLLQEIGEGGMGVVYMAEQEVPVRRKVALKIIKPGMDSKQVVARFEAERQALSMMDHPNIAKVFDAGTTDTGLPYFVMELVHGVPITEYCDANTLTPRERLELFVPVCQAIQHAHMKGIIHRDVKPSNVLVTMYDDKPVPKVIDFGVAKAVEQRLTEKTLFTQYGALVGTFEYMSPEQAEMNAFGVDTRSDVYSLGVLLYELLTGTTPLERQRLRTAAFGEVVRLIKEEEPPKPSLRISTSGTLAKVAAARKTDPGKLSAVVRGELDWIVMRCLEKDRTRRYETAVGLARDVERHLNGDAVEACPPTLGYRLKKVYRKNRTAVRVGTAFALLLTAGIVSAVVLAVRATDAERVSAVDRDAAIHSAKLADDERDRANQEAANVRTERDRTRRLLYATQLASGSFALAEGRGENVLQALAETAPKPGETDLRGWEWHYLKRLYNTPIREVQLGTPMAPHANLPCLTELGVRSVVTRYDSGGIWFEVFETASGKRLGRAPKTGSIDDWGRKSGPHEPAVTALSPLPSGTLDATGRVVASYLLDGSKNAHRIRLWRVDTGEELAGPPGTFSVADGTPLTVGPDGDWVAWIERTMIHLRTPQQVAAGVVPVTVCRWVRGDKSPTSKAFTPEPGSGDVTLSGDGRVAIVDPYRHATWPPIPRLPTIRRLECWDLAADPPARRYAIPAGNNLFGQMHVSPGGTAIAVWNGAKIAVFGLKDDKPLWEHPFATNPHHQFGEATIVGVSDDGSRVLFAEPLKLTMIQEPNPKAGPADVWAVRHLPLSREDFQYVLGARSSPETTSPNLALGKLSPDGRTYFIESPPGNVGVGVLDLTSAHAQRAGALTKPRVSWEWCSDPAGPNAPANYLARDTEGNELGRISDLNGRGLPFLVAGRWVLAHRSLDAPAQFPGVVRMDETGIKWQLYDTAQPKSLRLVAEGAGRAAMTEDGRWVHASTPQSRFTPHYTTRTVYRPEDGRKVSEITAPAGTAFFRGRYEPGGGRWAAVTSAVPRPDPPTSPFDLGTAQQFGPAPLTVRLYEVGSGRELWKAEIGTAFPGGDRPLFSGDGRHLIVRVRESREAHRIDIFDLNDGTIAKTFRGPAGLPHALAGEAADGTLMFISAGEVQLWNPATGALTHRLAGLVKNVQHQLAASPDGRRLFVYDPPQATSTARIHVWDLTTERELLVLTFNGPPPGDTKLEYVDGKIRLTSPHGVQVFDGTPLPGPEKK